MKQSPAPSGLTILDGGGDTSGLGLATGHRGVGSPR